MMEKRVVLACGGTGGHFYPAYALARALIDRGWRTLFILRKDDPAAKILTQEDLPFVELDLRGMPRSVFADWPGFALRVFGSLRLARNILRSFSPRYVVGMGGYITFPTIAAAGWLRIPAMLHESNAKLGFANRACLPFVSRVAMGLPITRVPRWPSTVRYELTGTPVRGELLSLPSSSETRRSLGLDPNRPTLLIFGGSQGARGINRMAPEAVKEIAKRRPDSLQCLHLSGPKEEASVRSDYEGAQAKVVVKGFMQEMHKAYAVADLVLSRSGASTIAELCVVRKPAILIPFPSAAAGHQEDNAEVLAGAGAAKMIREPELNPNSLAHTIEDLILSSNPASGKLSQMAAGYASANLPKPQETIAALVKMVESLGAAER